MSNCVGNENYNIPAEHAETANFQVNVVFPPFWPNNPTLWFYVLEAQFQLLRIITDDVKYNYLVGNLDCKFLTVVEDIVRNPPALCKYEKIKIELIMRFKALQEQRARKLLENQEMGDRKPSEFLEHLRNLVDSPALDELVRTFWIKHLPDHIQYIIMPTLANSTLDNLANTADVINQVIPTPKTFAASPPQTIAMSELNNLNENLEKLSHRIGLLQMRSCEQSRSSSSFSSSHELHSRSNSSIGSKQCWYHWQFGSSAKKCVHPCNYNSF